MKLYLLDCEIKSYAYQTLRFQFDSGFYGMKNVYGLFHDHEGYMVLKSDDLYHKIVVDYL